VPAAAAIKAAQSIEHWPLDRLKPYDRNARTHTPEQVAQIAASIQEFGFTNPILVDGKDGIIAGHGRLQAARELAMATVPVVVLDHLTPTQRRAYVIADNQLAMNAGWDMHLLQQEVVALQLQDFDLDLLGFDDNTLEDITNFLEDDPTVNSGEHGLIEDDGTRTEEEEAKENEKSDGSLLALIDIAIDEPKHQVETGDVWKVGPHLLFICSVMTDWQVWSKYLNSDHVIFCPYPGPFVPLAVKADDHVLVMVQPDRYVAGHLLDRYAEVKGEATIKKAGAA
jgi:hypothetical protein